MENTNTEKTTLGKVKVFIRSRIPLISMLIAVIFVILVIWVWSKKEKMIIDPGSLVPYHPSDWRAWQYPSYTSGYEEPILWNRPQYPSYISGYQEPISRSTWHTTIVDGVEYIANTNVKVSQIKEADTTPTVNNKTVNAVAFRAGKVSQHFDTSRQTWMTDPDGKSWFISAENPDKILAYCQKFFPNTTSTIPLWEVLIKDWKEAWNINSRPWVLPAYGCIE